MPRYTLMEFPFLSCFSLVQWIPNFSVDEMYSGHSTSWIIQRKFKGMLRVIFAFSFRKLYPTNLYYYLLESPFCVSLPIEGCPSPRLQFASTCPWGLTHSPLPMETFWPQLTTAQTASPLTHTQRPAWSVTYLPCAPPASSRLEGANMQNICSMERK